MQIRMQFKKTIKFSWSLLQPSTYLHLRENRSYDCLKHHCLSHIFLICISHMPYVYEIQHPSYLYMLCTHMSHILYIYMCVCIYRAIQKLIVQILWRGWEYVRIPISLRKVCPQMYACACKGSYVHRTFHCVSIIVLSYLKLVLFLLLFSLFTWNSTKPFKIRAQFIIKEIHHRQASCKN